MIVEEAPPLDIETFKQYLWHIANWHALMIVGAPPIRRVEHTLGDSSVVISWIFDDRRLSISYAWPRSATSGDEGEEEHHVVIASTPPDAKRDCDKTTARPLIENAALIRCLDANERYQELIELFCAATHDRVDAERS